MPAWAAAGREKTSSGVGYGLGVMRVNGWMILVDSGTRWVIEPGPPLLHQLQQSGEVMMCYQKTPF